ncbi:hypothetical protein EVA_15212 [gut metagenome]|uniref:Uncharacterized protein n=1 Tax=gut metagenome TaxID=749906 RepID=J9FQC4_9ZZZZ
MLSNPRPGSSRRSKARQPKRTNELRGKACSTTANEAQPFGCQRADLINLVEHSGDVGITDDP